MKQRLFFGWWQVVVALLVQCVAIGSIGYCYSIVVVPLAVDFEASRLTLMLGMSAMTLVSGLIAPWLGASIDRYSLKLLMIVGALALGAGYVALSFINQIWQMPLIYALCMSFSGVLLGPLTVSTLLARWFHQRRGLALGIAAMGNSIGGLLFPPLVQFLIDSFEWRVAFRLLGGLTLLINLPAIALLVSNWPAERGLYPDGNPHSPDTSGARVGERFNAAGTILRSRNFWCIALVMSVLFATYNVLLSNLVPFTIDKGFEPERGALLVSIIAITGLVGKLLFGATSDHTDLRLGLAGAISFLVVGFACYLSSSRYDVLIAGSVFVGLSAGGALPVWSAMLAQLFGVYNYGRVMGLMIPVFMPLNFLAPPLTGGIYDATGSYQLAFMIVIVWLLAALALLPFIHRPDKPL